MNPQILIEELKEVMKKRGVTYKDIANKLELSESGVKKILTSKDISTARLLEICDIVDISLSSLLELSKDRKVDYYKLNERQEKAFTENLNLFNAVFQLWEVNFDMEKFRKNNRHISKTKMDGIIRDLVNLGILAKEGDQYTSPLGDGFTNSKKFTQLTLGPLKRNIADTMLKAIEKSHNTKTKTYLYESIYNLKLSEKSQTDLKIALKDICQEFFQRSTRERKQYPADKLTEITLSIDALPMRIVDLHPIKP